MATAATGWYCGCSASVTAQTDTTATITVTCYWVNNGWNYNISYVSAWVYCGSNSYQVMNSGKVNSTGVGNHGQVSCGSYSFVVNKATASQSLSCYAKISSNGTYVSGTKSSSTSSISVSAITSYTVSYNANGGSGAPGAQTKYYGITLKLSGTKPTRTGYTFKGWATSSSGSVAYASGAEYKGNAAVTLYAVWQVNSYKVTYDANGGSGAPGEQTKYYGTALTLSTTKPTRTNYNFLGWGTSAGTTTVSYAAGASYTANTGITLYAIWELAYLKPRITDLVVARCDASGTLTENGTYVKVTFNWSTDRDIVSAKVYWKLITDSSFTEANSDSATVSGTSGLVNKVMGDGKLGADNMYDILVVVTDSVDNTPIARVLQGISFPIDVLAGGSGVAIGKAATLPNTLDIYKQTVVRGNEDVSETGDSGQLIVGDPQAYHLALDGNEIVAKSDSETFAQLHLNKDGGTVYVGDKLVSVGQITAREGVRLYNNKALTAINTSGVERSMVGISASDVYLYGYGSYSANEGEVYFEGNSVFIRSKGDVAITSPNAGLSKRAYGVNKVLWSSAWYMNASQTLTLSESVSAQPNGIVLVWSSYTDGTAHNYDFYYHFVPKQHVSSFSGSGVTMTMFTVDWVHSATKYVYISNTTITGHDKNTLDSAGSSVDFDNQYWVLRQVIGV